MTTDDLHHLSGKRRNLEYRLWRKWLRHAVTIRAELRDWSEQIGPDDDFDPFRYNETASVSALACAASRAGFPVMTEFCTKKRNTDRRKKHRRGRCDLWIGDPSSHHNWGIEFKQLFAIPDTPKTAFDQILKLAKKDASDITDEEAETALAGVVMVIDLSYLTGQEDIVTMIRRFDDFCRSSFMAFRIGNDTKAIWFIFERPCDRTPVALT